MRWLRNELGGKEEIEINGLQISMPNLWRDV